MFARRSLFSAFFSVMFILLSFLPSSWGYLTLSLHYDRVLSKQLFSVPNGRLSLNRKSCTEAKFTRQQGQNQLHMAAIDVTDSNFKKEILESNGWIFPFLVEKWIIKA
jgi:hypothetical protein